MPSGLSGDEDDGASKVSVCPRGI